MKNPPTIYNIEQNPLPADNLTKYKTKYNPNIIIL